jgi:hypothetical protein
MRGEVAKDVAGIEAESRRRIARINQETSTRVANIGAAWQRERTGVMQTRANAYANLAQAQTKIFPAQARKFDAQANLYTKQQELIGNQASKLQMEMEGTLPMSNQEWIAMTDVNNRIAATRMDSHYKMSQMFMSGEELSKSRRTELNSFLMAAAKDMNGGIQAYALDKVTGTFSQVGLQLPPSAVMVRTAGGDAPVEASTALNEVLLMFDDQRFTEEEFLKVLAKHDNKPFVEAMLRDIWRDNQNMRHDKEVDPEVLDAEMVFEKVYSLGSTGAHETIMPFPEPSVSFRPIQTPRGQ